MRRFLTGLTLLWLLYAYPADAQSSSTDPNPTRWINYGQTYYRIPVAQVGLYRLTTDDLRRAGLPTDRIDPRTLQLFHRGVEQAVYVAGEANGQLDSDDFLEFYGRGNDGVPDSLLYRTDDGSGTDTPGSSTPDASAQPHSYYSLFSDTTTYFLTWRLDQKPGRRMVAYTDTNRAGLLPEPYYWAEERRLFTDTYPGWAAGIPPYIEYSHYQAGEGYTGPLQQKDTPYTNAFTLTNAVRDGPPVELDLLLAGRDFTGHRVDCLTGSTSTTQRLTGTLRFSTYANARLRVPVTWTDVGTGGELVVSTVSRGDDAPTDRYSVSYVQVRYPRRFTVDAEPTRTFRLRANPTDRSLLTWAGTASGMRFWDVTDPTNPIRLSTFSASDTTWLIVRHTATERIVFGSTQPRKVVRIQPVTFVDWSRRRPTYLIVSHEALMQPIDGSNPVQAYAVYRASAAGGSHDTLTATVQQLFDQFSYGERHPLAIRRFASQMLRQTGGKPPYLLLLGRGRSTPGIRRDSNQATLDLVMTAGYPGSDVLFTTGLNGQPRDVPALPTGRVNAGTPQAVLDYLNKVRDVEALPPGAPWRKNVLHLSGGSNPAEAQTFQQLVDTYRTIAGRPSLGASVTTISKATDQPVERIDIRKPINEGVGLVTFFGHSGLDVTDLDIGFCSDDALGYRNAGRYPLLLVNGCAVGNFFYGRPTLTTDWVLAPGRGAIAAIAQSHLGYVDNLDQYTTQFYTLLTDSLQLNRSIGQLQQETIRRVLAHSPSGRDLANCQQMVLQGDPALRLFPFRTADFALSVPDVRLVETAGQPLTPLSDSVRLSVVVHNVGQYRPGPLPIRVRRFRNEQVVGVFSWLLPRTIAHHDTLSLVLPNSTDTEGLNRFEITVNPSDRNGLTALPEDNQTNNQVSIERTLTGGKPVLIYPAPGSTVSTRILRLTAHYATERTHDFAFEIDTSARFDSPQRHTQRIRGTAVISWPVTLPNPFRTTYYWRVRRNDTDERTQPSADGWSTGLFTYAPGSSPAALPEGQLQPLDSLPAAVQQGDVVTISGQFVNLSPQPFADSVVIRQVIYAASRAEPVVSQWRMVAPAGYDTLRISSRIATESLPGVNRVVLTVNPRLQPEYSFLNNTLDLPLTVQPDMLPPLLDVTFDGIRIENGAVVASRPRLDVLVVDDNRALLRRDTTGLDLHLLRPGTGQSFRRISWRDAIVQPAGTDNICRVQCLLPALSEGAYQLRVTARDAVGNVAAPYQVSFRITPERSLASLRVYPNPFRERVWFAFRLTGDTPPEVTELVITDESGRAVRHLRSDTTGPAVRVGLNEWVWDGRSDTGDTLPAGLYLYRLTTGTAQQPWSGVVGQPTTEQGRIILIR